MKKPEHKYDPAIHHRRSIRLRGHDYAGRGVYFITICVAKNRPLFGTVVNGQMVLNDAGRIAAACWRDIPMVQLLARGLPNTFPPHVRRAIDNGRCLIATPFDASVDRFSAARAAWCNQYTLHLSRNIVIGQLSTDGMLACLLSDLPENKPITFLKK